MQKNIERILFSLSKSKFRASFNLKPSDKAYVKKQGMDKILMHAKDFIQTRLAPAFPKNDGKQTPMRAHPVFIAQHATATCCRECLYKWHKIEKGRPLSNEEIDFVLALIMAWIQAQMEK